MRTATDARALRIEDSFADAVAGASADAVRRRGPGAATTRLYRAASRRRPARGGAASLPSRSPAVAGLDLGGIPSRPDDRGQPGAWELEVRWENHLTGTVAGPRHGRARGSPSTGYRRNACRGEAGAARCQLRRRSSGFAVVHLHGGMTQASSDGWTENIAVPGQGPARRGIRTTNAPRCSGTTTT